MHKVMYSKDFDTSTIQGLKAAERYKAMLNNKCDKVQVLTLGLDRIRINGQVSQ